MVGIPQHGDAIRQLPPPTGTFPRILPLQREVLDRVHQLNQIRIIQDSPQTQPQKLRTLDQLHK